MTDQRSHTDVHEFDGSVRRRLIIVISLLVLLPMLLVIYISYDSTRTVLLNNKIKEEQIAVQMEANDIARVLTGYKEDVLFLSESPEIKGLVRATLHEEGIDEVDGSTREQWISRSKALFKDLVMVNDAYLQVRYLDQEGNEQIRIDRKDGQVVHIEGTDLQYKGDRYYFKETIKKDRHQVYVSPLDLNREGSPPTIQTPYQPVIRYGIPVYAATEGSPMGVIIANIRADYFLDSIRDANNSDVAIKEYFVDKNGFFLVHPDPLQEWGSPRDLDTGYNMNVQMEGAVAAEILSGKKGKVERPGLEDVILFEPIYPNSNDPMLHWTVYRVISWDHLLAPALATRDRMIIIAGLMGLLSILLSILFSRSISKPIRYLTRMATSMAEGNYLARAKVYSNDEIGLLTVSFNKMADQVILAQTNLENKVTEKTEELDRQLQLSEKSKRAVLNILEDAQDQAQSLKDARRATLNVMEDLEEERSALTKAKAKDEAILGSIGDGIVAIDTKGNVIIFNLAAQEMLEQSSSDAIGKSWKEVIIATDAEGTPMDPSETVIDTVFTSRAREIRTCHYKRHDETIFPVAVTAAPVIQGEELLGVIVVFRDITKEQQIDQAKTEFVSLASHQLRTPLSAINWYTEMLLAGDVGELTKEQHEYLERIYTGNQRMVDLVNSLLNVSRLELGTFMVEPEVLDIAKIADDVIDEITPRITARKIQFSHTYDHGIPEMPLDKKLTFMVFQNLLSNAIKYTPEGGNVRLAIEKKGEHDMLITVEDNGYGIPVQQQNKIFTKLFRADNVRAKDTDGTGLGLYIIKSIVDHVGGKIWFDSAEDKGTTFYVELPLTGMEEKEGTKSMEGGPKGDGKVEEKVEKKDTEDGSTKEKKETEDQEESLDK